MTEEEKKLKDKISEKINSGQVEMRSHKYFITRAVLAVAGIVILSLSILFLASLIIFVLRQSGVWYTPSFGLRGIGIFLVSLPWVLVLMLIGFILLLEVALKKYSFAYRKPLLYTALGILVFVVVGGFVFAQTPIHPGLYQHISEGALPPPAHMLYRGLAMPHSEDVYVGQILETRGDYIIIETLDSEQYMVLIKPDTRMPKGQSFSIGDSVAVIGDKKEDMTIEAFGIRGADHFVPGHPEHLRKNIKGKRLPPIMK